ncbi:MAG: hypothetical protein DRP45_00045 [Candidatus Zixiibacteriota bacterium]|nr:MAG: hypothetical protein DRP45_00045 [candidate division Zixibacteria bacterium]
MWKPDSRLLFFCTVFGLLALVWGCSQTDDINAPASVTYLYLDVDQLPNLPAGMQYELWVSRDPVTDTSIVSDKLVSMGRFSYIRNDTIAKFLDSNGVVRTDSCQFTLDGDIYDFASIFVTIETEEIDSIVRLGPIMQIASIAGNPEELRLYFPLLHNDGGLNSATARYNMECVTDNNRASNDFHGLWFSSYQYLQQDIPDTFDAYISSVPDTILPITNESGDTINEIELSVWHPEALFVEVETLHIGFGRDTVSLDVDSFMHQRVNVLYSDSVKDSVWPIIYNHYTVVYDSAETIPPVPPDTIETINNFPAYNPHNVNLDLFTQDDFALPNYSGFGWKYQGWILSYYIDGTTIIPLGKFTPPAWYDTASTGYDWFPGSDGGLLTTGKFSRIDDPDDSDPFIVRSWLDTASNPILDSLTKRPMVPGEDFLAGQAMFDAGIIADPSHPVDLLPYGNPWTYGCVFISLEPANKISDTTNFPLIPFWASFPYTRDGANSPGDAYHMNMRTATSGDQGLPRMVIKLKRM